MARGNKIKDISRWVRRHQNKHLCGCGCGGYVIVTRAHAKPSVGIPKFIKSHNLRPKLPPEEVEALKEKSGWDKLSPEDRERRVSQLKSFKKGEENPSWKGGRLVDENGYVRVLVPNHPFSRGGYVMEHRLLVEARTRVESPEDPLLVEIAGVKYLEPSTVVHHIDEDKTNNSEDNLMLLASQKFHAFLHNSPLPMEEVLRRISLGISHSRKIEED